MVDERNELTHEHMRALGTLLSGKSDEALSRMYYGAANYIQNNIKYLSPQDEAHLTHMGESAWPGVNVPGILGGVKSQSRPHRSPYVKPPRPPNTRPYRTPPRESADRQYRAPPRPPSRPSRPSRPARPPRQSRPVDHYPVDHYPVDHYPVDHYPVDHYRPKKEKVNPIPYIVVAVLMCAVALIGICIYQNKKKQQLASAPQRRVFITAKPAAASEEPVDNEESSASAMALHAAAHAKRRSQPGARLLIDAVEDASSASLLQSSKRPDPARGKERALRSQALGRRPAPGRKNGKGFVAWFKKKLSRKPKVDPNAVYGLDLIGSVREVDSDDKVDSDDAFSISVG